MELEEMKNIWDDVSQEIDKQKILTDKSIVNITKKRYANKIRAISIPETIFAFISIAFSFFVLINFTKLDTWYLSISGIIVVLFLIIVPVFSVKWIRTLRNLDLTGNTFKQSLFEYVKGKQRFINFIKVSSYLTIPFIIAFMLIAEKIFNNNNLISENDFGVYWYVLPLGIIIQILFNKWILIKYNKTINEAENILKELEQ
jgi:membrane protein YdbS with pleckstrin-like domain